MKKGLRMKQATMMAATIVNNIVLMCSVVYGSGGGNQYAESAGKWVLEGVFWVILIAVVAGIGTAILKRNLVGALSTLICGGLVLFFVKNPDAIATIGETIAGAIGIGK